MLCIPSLSLQGDGSATSPKEVPDLSSPGSPLSQWAALTFRALETPTAVLVT